MLLGSNLNIFQRKAINILIYNAQMNQTPQNTDFFIGIKKLKEHAGFSLKDSNDVYVKDKILELYDTKFNSNLFSNNKKQIFKTLSYSNSIIKYTFLENFLSKIQNPPNPIELNLDIIKNYTSKYSIALYEILKTINFKKGTKLSINFLRWYFCIEKYQYKATADLKKKLIDTAVDEINEFSDINITYESIKYGKKIYGYDFTILPAENLEKDIKNHKIIEKIYIINKIYNNTQFYSEKHQSFFYFANIKFVEKEFELEAYDESFNIIIFYFKSLEEICIFLKKWTTL